MDKDYKRIKEYLNSRNWHLEENDFYKLVECCPEKIGYKINFNLNHDNYYSIHFWFMHSDLFGDVYLKKL